MWEQTNQCENDPLMGDTEISGRSPRKNAWWRDFPCHAKVHPNLTQPHNALTFKKGARKHSQPLKRSEYSTLE
jgi:hypothetical protein